MSHWYFMVFWQRILTSPPCCNASCPIAHGIRAIWIALKFCCQGFNGEVMVWFGREWILTAIPFIKDTQILNYPREGACDQNSNDITFLGGEAYGGRLDIIYAYTRLE